MSAIVDEINQNSFTTPDIVQSTIKFNEDFHDDGDNNSES